jgi:toxin ParE1/3/4
MVLKTTVRADEDVISIYVYGARRFGLEQADEYHAGLIRTFQFLLEHPYAARERTDLKPPVRLHSYGSHLIVYRIMMDHVLIVRVLHGRSDWQRYL